MHGYVIKHCLKVMSFRTRAYHGDRYHLRWNATAETIMNASTFTCPIKNPWHTVFVCLGNNEFEHENLHFACQLPDPFVAQSHRPRCTKIAANEAKIRRLAAV